MSENIEKISNPEEQLSDVETKDTLEENVDTEVDNNKDTTIEPENEDSEEENNDNETKLTKYFVFKPFQFVYKTKQADKNGLFVCLEGSEEEKSCIIKKGFEVSKYIRDLGFVSKETVEKTLNKVLEKAENLKAENEELKTKLLDQKNRADTSELERGKENLANKEKIEKLEAENEELKGKPKLKKIGETNTETKTTDKPQKTTTNKK